MACDCLLVKSKSLNQPEARDLLDWATGVAIETWYLSEATPNSNGNASNDRREQLRKMPETEFGVDIAKLLRRRVSSEANITRDFKELADQVIEELKDIAKEEEKEELRELARVQVEDDPPFQYHSPFEVPSPDWITEGKVSTEDEAASLVFRLYRALGRRFEMQIPEELKKTSNRQDEDNVLTAALHVAEGVLPDFLDQKSEESDYWPATMKSEKGEAAALQGWLEIYFKRLKEWLDGLEDIARDKEEQYMDRAATLLKRFENVLGEQCQEEVAKKWLEAFQLSRPEMESLETIVQNEIHGKRSTIIAVQTEYLKEMIRALKMYCEERPVAEAQKWMMSPQRGKLFVARNWPLGLLLKRRRAGEVETVEISSSDEDDDTVRPAQSPKSQKRKRRKKDEVASSESRSHSPDEVETVQISSSDEDCGTASTSQQVRPSQSPKSQKKNHRRSFRSAARRKRKRTIKAKLRPSRRQKAQKRQKNSKSKPRQNRN